MKAPIAGVFIFRLTIRAHIESGHGSSRPVIGNVADDGVPRPAMRAIGEWISKAPVRRISKIAPALVARAGVGRDQCECTSLLPAAQDREADVSPKLDVGDA